MTHLITAALLLLAMGCGAGGGAGEPQAGESCEQIADDTVATVNDVIAEMGDKTLEEFVAEAAEGGEDAMAMPPELQARMDEMQPRAEAAGCSDDEMATLLQERADDIEGEGFVAEMIRGAFQEGQSLGESTS